MVKQIFKSIIRFIGNEINEDLYIIGTLAIDTAAENRFKNALPQSANDVLILLKAEVTSSGNKGDEFSDFDIKLINGARKTVSDLKFASRQEFDYMLLEAGYNIKEI